MIEFLDSLITSQFNKKVDMLNYMIKKYCEGKDLEEIEKIYDEYIISLKNFFK